MRKLFPAVIVLATQWFGRTRKPLAAMGDEFREGVESEEL